MRQTLQILGSHRGELVEYLSDWQSDGQRLWRPGPEKTLCVSFGETLPGALPLGDNPGLAWEMLRWFFDWEMRPAQTSDVSEMCALKASRIRETFLFLSSTEREREVQDTANQERMGRELEEDDFWVCRRDNELWALAGLRELSAEEGLLVSGYSRGARAGSALLAQLIKEAMERGYRRLWAEVYGYNEQSPAPLKRAGFRLSNRLHTSRTNPPHRIRGWVLRLPG